tara:strand:+ start:503 stop:961 length:459 start_codon:yes stop_codon:yes gene_type:complete
VPSLTSSAQLVFGSKLLIVALRLHRNLAASVSLAVLTFSFLLPRYHVAKFLERGLLGYDTNLYAAAALYARAASQGHPEAQRRLSILYFKGTGVEKDEVKSAALFKHAQAQSPIMSIAAEPAFASPEACARPPRLLFCHARPSGLWRGAFIA